MSTIKLYPQHYDPDADATCGDCGDTFRAIECGPIRDPSERLNSGDPLPAGECPTCASLSYVEDRKSDGIQFLADAARDLRDIIQRDIDSCEEADEEPDPDSVRDVERIDAALKRCGL